jgi:hypothetical protein
MSLVHDALNQNDENVYMSVTTRNAIWSLDEHLHISWRRKCVALDWKISLCLWTIFMLMRPVKALRYMIDTRRLHFHTIMFFGVVMVLYTNAYIYGSWSVNICGKKEWTLFRPSEVQLLIIDLQWMYDDEDDPNMFEILWSMMLPRNRSVVILIIFIDILAMRSIACTHSCFIIVCHEFMAYIIGIFVLFGPYAWSQNRLRYLHIDLYIYILGKLIYET